jgi:hypothetical protein
MDAPNVDWGWKAGRLGGDERLGVTSSRAPLSQCIASRCSAAAGGKEIMPLDGAS